MMRYRTVRYVLATSIGFVFGAWWGDRLALLGRDDLPAVRRDPGARGRPGGRRGARDGRRAGTAGERERPDGDVPDRFAVLVAPWRWDAGRLAGFAALNLAIAIGISVGFDPLPG